MKYEHLTDADQKEIGAKFLQSQEIDHYCHTVNAERYRNILNDPTLSDGEFKERIQKLLAETEARLVEVELIVKHTTKQKAPV